MQLSRGMTVPLFLRLEYRRCQTKLICVPSRTTKIRLGRRGTVGKAGCEAEAQCTCDPVCGMISQKDAQLPSFLPSSVPTSEEYNA